MATTADIKNGMCIELDGQYYIITEFLHVKPGKGAAFVRTKLKNVVTGRTIDKTFNAGVKIDEVRIERRPYETFEQVSVNKELINGVDFLKEGMICDVVTHAESETILYVDLPTHVTLQVTYTEPGLKGDTATNATKPATVETGAVIRVPLFINEGELIKVDTRDGSYVERVKTV